MARLIKRPELTRVSPPFFEVLPGHAVKVFAADEARWVRVLSVQCDELLGMVLPAETGPDPCGLVPRDVIEFKLCHVFGLF